MSLRATQLIGWLASRDRTYLDLIVGRIDIEFLGTASLGNDVFLQVLRLGLFDLCLETNFLIGAEDAGTRRRLTCNQRCVLCCLAAIGDVKPAHETTKLPCRIVGESDDGGNAVDVVCGENPGAFLGADSDTAVRLRLDLSRHQLLGLWRQLTFGIDVSGRCRLANIDGNRHRRSLHVGHDRFARHCLRRDDGAAVWNDVSGRRWRPCRFCLHRDRRPLYVADVVDIATRNFCGDASPERLQFRWHTGQRVGFYRHGLEFIGKANKLVLQHTEIGQCLAERSQFVWRAGTQHGGVY